MMSSRAQYAAILAGMTERIAGLSGPHRRSATFIRTRDPDSAAQFDESQQGFTLNSSSMAANFIDASP
jgi:hypothetical protein